MFYQPAHRLSHSWILTRHFGDLEARTNSAWQLPKRPLPTGQHQIGPAIRPKPCLACPTCQRKAMGPGQSDEADLGPMGPPHSKLPLIQALAHVGLSQNNYVRNPLYELSCLFSLKPPKNSYQKEAPTYCQITCSPQEGMGKLGECGFAQQKSSESPPSPPPPIFAFASGLPLELLCRPSDPAQPQPGSAVVESQIHP